METAPCVLLEYHEDITVNVARQISANKFGERPGAWQRMRTLGELIRAKSMGEESTRKEAIRKFANATGMNPGTLASIVSAYNCLNYKARDLLEDNLREASWIPERTLLKIAHKKPEKHFDQIAKALGFNENGEIDPSTQTRKTRGAARRPRRFHHEIQTLLGVRGPVRVTVVPSRTKTVVEIATKGKKPLNTSGEWTLDMVRMLRQSIDVALEKLTSTLQPHKDETTTERDGTVVAIVPTRDYHEMTCDHNIPPLKPLE
jgi:hypothetical protein